MSLAREVITQLRAALATIAGARDETAAVKEFAAEIGAEIRTATDGSTAEKPAEAVVRLEQARVRLDEAIAEFDGGTVAVEGYIEVLERGSGSGGGSEQVVRPSPARPSALRPFKPMRTDPAKVAEIRHHVGLDYAVATLWDGDGNRILGPHQADGDGPAARAKWRPPWRDYPRLRRHVEAHAAARLRPGDTMVMYINMSPCSYPDGCVENLRDVIPRDATLVVHQVHASGWVDVTAYRGTGRACD